MLNTELLRKVRDQIEREPRQFLMSLFFTNREQEDLEGAIPNCGTAACIGGWTVCLAKGLNPQQQLAKSYCVGKEAAGILGLAYHDPELFYVDMWPDPFRSDYAQATTQEARAAAAVRLLDEILDGKRDPNTLEVIPG